VHLLREKLELCNKDGAHATVVHLHQLSQHIFPIVLPWYAHDSSPVMIPSR
ncbi:hypothetical protein L9F63_007237, partial [Diploptera punctata]